MKKTMLLLCLLCSFLSTPSFAVLNKAASLRVNREAHPRTRYDITVDISPQMLTYSGHQKVIFTNTQNAPASYLLFFLYPNDPSLTKTNNKYLTVSNVMVDQKETQVEEKDPFLRIPLKRELIAGHEVTVEFDFKGSVPAQTETKDLFTETIDQLMSILNPGQSEPDYGIFSSSKDIVNLGLWYPILSKYNKDGWDEEKYAGIGDVSYFDPADFNVSILAPFNFHVVTSGSVLKRVPQKDQKTRYDIEAPMSRDFEIELSSRYQEGTRLDDRTILRSYFLPEHSESGKLALEAGLRAFQYYEETFGPYPYTELDIVEAPLYGGAGGVEFPGLVTISSMLYKTSNAEEEQDFLKQMMSNNPAFDQLLEFVVAHEVAHQWWNAVVGSNSKKYPFIDEAMANYSAVLYFEHYYGRPAAEQQMAMQMKMNYQLHRLAGGSDKAVRLPASSFKGPLEYSAIVYGKGALYFDHLRTLIGSPAFFASMKSYYDSYWFRIAEPEALERIAQREAPEKAEQIAALFQRWMDEKHGDEDIGPGTLEGLMKTIMSTQGDMPAKGVEDLMKQLNDVLKQ